MKRNRIIVLGIPLILILLGLILYEYGYLRIQSKIASIKEDQALKIKTLEKYTAFINERPQLEKELNSLKELRRADDPKLIEGQTLSLAAATLQDMVKGIIVGRGGTISSERVGKPEDHGKFKIINVSIDAVLPDVRVLSDILYSIETRTPYLIVKELDTRVRDYRNPKELMVKLDVSALTTAK